MTTYLADKSALVHMSIPRVAAKLEPLILTGEVATCGVIELEVLYSARSEKDLIGTRSRRAAAFPRVAMSEEDFLRAEEVIAQLAKRVPVLVVKLGAEGAMACRGSQQLKRPALSVTVRVTGL